MQTLIGEKVFLRALEPEDLEFLYLLENEESIWEVSNTMNPYSKYILKQYLENSHRDIFEVKQLRLVICNVEDKNPLGFIDLFDFDPKNKRAGVGIIIFNESDRKKGYAKEAIELSCRYAFQHLDLHQLYAGITENNVSSVNLFEKIGFERSGIKKDWIFSEGKYKNEYFYQLTNKVK